MTYQPTPPQEIRSSLNLTTTPLTAGQTFVGTAELNNYTSVSTQVKTDQDGTLYMEFSPDGTNWDTSLSFNYKDGQINAPKWLVKFNRYFRIRFTNTSSDPQSVMRLYSFFSDQAGVLVAPVNGTLSETFDASVTRPTDYHYEVAMGKRQGRSTINKFGYNKDIDTSTDPEIVASFGGQFDPTTDVITTAQTFDIAYNNTTDGSDAGATGATMLLIDYLDADFELQQGVHVLGDTGTDTTSFSGLGINRAVIIANSGAGFNVNDITLTASVDATTQAQIPAGDSTTQQLILHTPINTNFLLDWLYINVLKISGGGGDPRVKINGYSWSRVTLSRYKIYEEEVDTVVENTIVLNPSQPFVLGGREVLFFVAETDTNNTAISMRFSGILERVN